MADVSRETSPPRLGPPPEAASAVFTADRLPLAQEYAELLAHDGVIRGLLGPREVPRLWERHLLNCAVLSELVPPESSVADLGSGAGLPGLVLAIARPDVRVTLVEPLERRARFLTEVLDRLGLADVTVVRARAEALHGVRTFGVVTSRALAPLPRLVEWSMPLVSGHGAMVAMKGASARDEIDRARPVLHRLRCADPEVLTIGETVPGATTTVVRVSWAVPGRVGWPIATRVGSGTDRPTRRGGRHRA